MLKSDVQYVAIQLSSVFAGTERAKDICMKRQQFLEDWVTYAKYPFLQQAKYADIPAQAGWSKIMFNECGAFIHAKLLAKVDVNKATGPDGLSNRILKEIGPAIAYPLTL